MPNRQYDWGDKRDICYKLWVEQQLTLPQLLDYFADKFKVPISALPSRKQFLTQFKTWGFPKHRTEFSAEKEALVVARLRELFNQNLRAKRIQETLNDEGWEVDNYHFLKFRRRYGLLKRGLPGYKPAPPRKKRKLADEEETDGEDQEVEDRVQDRDLEANGEIATQSPSLPPEEAARRAQRLADLEVQSQELLRTNKRHRRIRGYGHLPPDDPGLGPRYASETSLDECKAFLHFSNETYVQTRAEFENICREMGIIKMSLCAEGQWQAAKDQLVRENVHLASQLHPVQPDIDKKTNALNIVCMDVTKRMRLLANKLTIADANNLLGLDPIQSKDVRRLLYKILEEDHFTTVIACGKEHLNQLQEKWYAESDVLQRTVREGDPQKLRALYLLRRDTLKRYWDDQVRKDPSKKHWQKTNYHGPGPGPVNGKLGTKNGPIPSAASTSVSDTPQQDATPQTGRHVTFEGIAGRMWTKQIIPVGPEWQDSETPDWSSDMAIMTPPVNFNLDPQLERLRYPTHGPPWPPTSSGAPSKATAADYHPGISSASVPAYFRLNPASSIIGHHPKMWLGKLSTPTVTALHTAATSKAGAARATKVQGVVKNEDGSEDSWLVESDDELAVYLEEAGEKATFVVVLEGGYA